MNARQIQDLAERLLTPERVARFRQVAATRLNCLTVVFESPHDPHNALAGLRSAESFGLATAHVIAAARGRLRGNVDRGAQRWLTVTSHASFAAAATHLRTDGYTLVGAMPGAPACPFAELPLPPKLAIFMGEEHAGLSAQAIGGCDRSITIPTVGFTESLNLSTATAILLQHFAAAYRARGADSLLTAAEQEALVLAWCEREIGEKTRGLLPDASD